MMRGLWLLPFVLGESAGAARICWVPPAAGLQILPAALVEPNAAAHQLKLNVTQQPAPRIHGHGHVGWWMTGCGWRWRVAADQALPLRARTVSSRIPISGTSAAAVDEPRRYAPSRSPPAKWNARHGAATAE